MMEQSTLKKTKKANVSGTSCKKSVPLPNVPYTLQSAYLSYVYAQESEEACAFAKMCYKKVHEGYVSPRSASLTEAEKACFRAMIEGYTTLHADKTWKRHFVNAVLAHFNT